MIKRLKKLGVEFMGIDESEEKEKGDIIITLFPNLISLEFGDLDEWEEWNGIGGGEEEESNKFTIIPRLQHLRIWECPKLKLLPNFLRTTPLQKLEIYFSYNLSKRCKRETGEEWPKISHIPNITLNSIYVQIDGQEILSTLLDDEDSEEDDKEEHAHWRLHMEFGVVIGPP